MIVGIGVDIEDIGRFDRAIERYGDRFLEKIFTDGEIAYCSGRGRCAQHFAARFAAKEAVLKALGTGLGGGLGLKDIEISKGERGEPRIHLKGAVRGIAQSLGVKMLHVSISHSCACSIAQVVAEGG